MPKLKVAHIICDLGPGGGQKSTIDLIKTTDDAIDNILILLENRKDYTPEGIRLFHVCNNKKIYKKLWHFGDMLLAYKLNKIITKNNIDIAISHMEVTAKVLHYIKIPKIYYIRTDIIQELENLKNKSLRRYKNRKKLYKKIFTNQNIITISKEIKVKLDNFITCKKIESIYNPFNISKIEQMTQESNKCNKEDYIVQIGSGFDVKGQDTLIEAFSKIKNQTINLKLLGTDKYSAIEELIKRYKLDKRVQFLGHKNNPYPYIKNAKLLVLSSKREGLPRVLIEGLILKTPIVSTDCKTGPKEIMTGELEKYLAKVSDADSLSQKIDLALHNFPKIEAKIVNEFDSAKIKKSFLNYIHDCKKI